MKKNLLTLCLSISLLFCSKAQAQFFNYLSTSAWSEIGSYNDLGTSGTKITTNFLGQAFKTQNDNSSIQNIGFTFGFAGVNYTQFTVNTNGFIKLGNDTVSISESSDVLFSTHAKSTNVIYAFNGNLQSTPISEYRVLTTGTAPSRTCIIQYKAVTDSGCLSCNPSSMPQYDNVEFQIILFEGSNNIDFVYGGFTPNLNPAGFVPYNCGLKSNNATNSVNATKSSQTPFINVAFIDGPYKGNRFNTRNNLLPISGFTIHWEPVEVKQTNCQLQNSVLIGKVPKLYDNVLSVNVRNIGISTLTNYTVNVDVTGANTLSIQQVIPSLASGDKVTVTFPYFSWPNAGKNTIIVSLPNDDDNNDNRDTLIQNVTDLTIGYCPDSAFGGRLGNTTNSIDMAVRFKNPIANKVMSVTAYIDTSGRSYRVYLYGVSGDTPKTKLTNPSTNITSVAGPNTLSYAPNGITVNSDFFVVVTQTNVTTSLRLGYQREDPIREKTFYFRIPQGTSINPSSEWNDFAPSNPFRLMVDVTMQTAFLPINLMNYNGYKEVEYNILTWQTQGEVNNAGFEIQRSNDGNNFVKIGFIDAKGNPNMLASYMYKDYNPLPGVGYYRIRQLDKDGKESFSDIIKIDRKEKQKLEIVKLYPNPSKDNATLVFNSASSDKMNINITNMMGKVVFTQVLNATKGENKIQLNTSNLPAGNYLINVAEMNTENFATTKFIKQ